MPFHIFHYYAECIAYFDAKLIVVMLNVVVSTVIMLNVVRLRVVAPMGIVDQNEVLENAEFAFDIKTSFQIR